MEVGRLVFHSDCTDGYVGVDVYRVVAIDDSGRPELQRLGFVCADSLETVRLIVGGPYGDAILRHLGISGSSDNVEVRTRVRCSSCGGSGYLEHPAWTSLYRERARPSELSEAELRSYFGGEVPEQEIPCDDCNGSGHVEAWVPLVDLWGARSDGSLAGERA